jgi:hypothetical protein
LAPRARDGAVRPAEGLNKTRLEEAVAAFRAVLEEWTRRVASQWRDIAQLFYPLVEGLLGQIDLLGEGEKLGLWLDCVNHCKPRAKSMIAPDVVS